MARSCHIIAEDCWRPGAEEDCACGLDVSAHLGSLARDHLTMLGRDLVREDHTLVQRLYLNEPAIALQCASDELRARQSGQLLSDFLFDCFKQLARGSHQPNTLMT